MINSEDKGENLRVLIIFMVREKALPKFSNEPSPFWPDCEPPSPPSYYPEIND